MAGALVDATGRVLIAQRPALKPMAGFWEFPGGKLEAGETRRAGLERELREELGVHVVAAHPLIRIRHRYPDRDVLLDVWRVREFDGTPSGRDGQALRWCEPEALPEADVLPADRPVITALRLPDRLSGTAGTNFEMFAFEEVPLRPSHRLRGIWCADSDSVRRAVQAGADFVALRVELPSAELAALCDAVNVPVYGQGFGLDAGWELGARGICGDSV